MITRQPRGLLRQRRHQRVRAKVHGSAERPRLNVFRSAQHIYAQVIDDDRGHTLAAASTLDPVVRTQLAEQKKTEEAAVVGRLIAERARAAGISHVVFDRGGYKYHGRVQQVADGARAGGLVF
jgi:large subunit ribosomal protein L18